MLVLKAIFTNGEEITTQFNATVDEAVKYYLNRTFNFGTECDNLQKCKEIQFISGAEIDLFGCVFEMKRVYIVPEEGIKEFSLVYDVRYEAVLSKASDVYKGANEINSAYGKTYRSGSFKKIGEA